MRFVKFDWRVGCVYYHLNHTTGVFCSVFCVWEARDHL